MPDPYYPGLILAASLMQTDSIHDDTPIPAWVAAAVKVSFCASVTRMRMESSLRCALGLRRFFLVSAMELM